MSITPLLASQPQATVHTLSGPAQVEVGTGVYSFVIDSNTSKLIISPNVLAPGNLRVTSGAPGSDIALAWNAGAGALNYIVQIRDSLGLRREFTTTFLSAIYTAADAVNDGGHKRSYTVRVASWNPSVGRSDYAEMVIENAAPATPIANITPQSGGFVINVENVLEADYAGMVVWAHTSAGVPMGEAHKVYDGYSQTATIPWTASSTAYFRVARYDTFGKGDLNVSSELFATKQKVPGLVQTDVLPGTTYLGDNVVFYTVGQEFYQWDTSLNPDSYVRAAPTITNGQMYAIDLKAISGSVGELKLGRMQLDAFGHIRGGQSGYNTGNGFWLGYDTDGKYKLSLANDSGDSMTFDQKGLIINGNAKVERRSIANLVLNPTFNTDLSDWFDLTNATRDTTVKLEGTASLRLGNGTVGGTATSRYFRVIPGQKYLIEARVRASHPTLAPYGIIGYIQMCNAIPTNGTHVTDADVTYLGGGALWGDHHIDPQFPAEGLSNTGWIYVRREFTPDLNELDPTYSVNYVSLGLASFGNAAAGGHYHWVDSIYIAPYSGRLQAEEVNADFLYTGGLRVTPAAKLIIPNGFTVAGGRYLGSMHIGSVRAGEEVHILCTAEIRAESYSTWSTGGMPPTKFLLVADLRTNGQTSTSPARWVAGTVNATFSTEHTTGVSTVLTVTAREDTDNARVDIRITHSGPEFHNSMAGFFAVRI